MDAERVGPGVVEVRRAMLNALHDMKGLWPAGLASVMGLGLVGAEDVDVGGLFTGAPTWVHVLSWILGILTAVGGFVLMVRRMISESDRKTTAVVAGAHQATAEGLARQFEQFRKEQRQKETERTSVSSQIAGLHNAMREMGDVREQMHALTFENGEHSQRLQRLEKGYDALHAWSRDMKGWREEAERQLRALTEKWRGTKDPNATPPGGTGTDGKPS